ncbi:MAG: hypothetical protein ACI4WS_05140 [Oscillospiraceae bacterium]
MSRIKKTDWAAAGVRAVAEFLLALLNFSLPHDIRISLRSAVMVLSLFLVPAGAGVLLRLFIGDKGRTALVMTAGSIAGLLLYSLCFHAGGAVLFALVWALLWSAAVSALYYFLAYCIQTTRRSRKAFVAVVSIATAVASVVMYSALCLFFGLLQMD